MGKKRIVKKGGGTMDQGLKSRALSRGVKRKLERGIIHIRASFNNTAVSLTDPQGKLIVSSSSGALGFKGAKKSTPYAAAKVGELLGEKAQQFGVKEVQIVVTGVGSGRESALRAFAAKGIDVTRIMDRTPIPFNGPRPRKARRV